MTTRKTPAPPRAAPPKFGANVAPSAMRAPDLGANVPLSALRSPSFGAGVASSALRTPNFGGGRSRVPGDQGAGLVVGIALIFAFTFLGLVWLARDVDRGVSNRSAAQSIAFQAARSGAQAAAVTDLRSGVIVIDPVAATRAVGSTAGALFASYGVEGAVTSVDVQAESVSVTVTITDDGRSVTGAGTVRAERAP